MNVDLLSWPTYFDSNGCLLDEYKLRKLSYIYGISDDTRKLAWPFLLNVWEKASSGTQRHSQEEKLRKQYESLRNGWINAVPELFDDEMKQYIKVIDKDVRRTDRECPYYQEESCVGLRMLRRILITLTVFDSELGYVQGMNEIISPILMAVEEEHIAFWCFVKLLPGLRDRLLTLDLSPQLSATANLIQYLDQELYQHIEHITAGHWIFCFRWYLLLFKNEFKMGDILKMWDALFSQHNTIHFEIFIAVAILLKHREQVLACDSSDQLLHFVQSVCSKLSVEPVVSLARELTNKIASTEGLSDNLRALVLQENKVPPPLVGFVRRRQCFKNVYSGRVNMNDDFIRNLMGSYHQTAPRTAPLFFNCTESPIPTPSSNFMSGIQGATPLEVAVKPELPPPPSSNVSLPSAGVTSLRHHPRPDALLRDSVSANPVPCSPNTTQGTAATPRQHFGEPGMQQPVDTPVFNQYNYGDENYNNYTNYNNLDELHSTNPLNIYQEPYYSAHNTHTPNNYAEYAGQYDDPTMHVHVQDQQQYIQQRYMQQQQHQYQQQTVQHVENQHVQQQHQYVQQQTVQHVENQHVQQQHQYVQQQAGQHVENQYVQQQHQYVQQKAGQHVENQHVQQQQHQQYMKQHVQRVQQQPAEEEKGRESPLYGGSGANNEALSKVCDDMWDMAISVQTNEALS